MAKRSMLSPAPPMSGSSEPYYCSTEVRKIDNGYVTRCTESGPSGYTTKETFSSEAPPKGDNPGGTGPNLLKGAKEALR